MITDFGIYLVQFKQVRISIIVNCYLLFSSWGSQVYWSGLLFPPSVDHILSELCTMTHLSWTALHGMAYSFSELHKALCHDKTVICEGQTQGDGEGQSWRVGHNSATEQQTVSCLWISKCTSVSYPTGTVIPFHKDLWRYLWHLPGASLSSMCLRYRWSRFTVKTWL